MCVLRLEIVELIKKQILSYSDLLPSISLVGGQL